MRAVGFFSVMNPGESEIFALDFVKDLRSGDSIASVAWTLTVAPNIPGNGVDANPQSHVIGGGSSLSGTIASQRIAGTLPAVMYVLLATATTALNDTLKLWAYLPSYAPGANVPVPVGT